MNRQHGVYKYVTIDTHKIIYIGKTNTSFKRRINNHSRGVGIEAKFNAYKDNFKVYIAVLPNVTETDIMERALINKYKPILNDTDNYDGFSGYITVQEPEWKEYIPEANNLISASSKMSKRIELERCHLFLGETLTSKVYINNFDIGIENGRRVKEYRFVDKEDALLCISILCKCCAKYGVKNIDGYEEKYVVLGCLFPGDIRRRLVDEPIFDGPLIIESEKGYFTKGIIYSKCLENGELVSAEFYKSSIDYLTACLQLWKYSIE